VLGRLGRAADPDAACSPLTSSQQQADPSAPPPLPPCRRNYNLAHKYGLASTYTPSQPSFVANHTNVFQQPSQYLLTRVDDPALGLLVPYGDKIHITSAETGLPCRLYPSAYERSPTGWALALFCNATDAGEEFTYEVSGRLARARCTRLAGPASRSLHQPGAAGSSSRGKRYC
jgi:hypothetical protein